MITYLRCALLNVATPDSPNQEPGLVVHPRQLGMTDDEVQAAAEGRLPAARAEDIAETLRCATLSLYQSPVAGHG